MKSQLISEVDLNRRSFLQKVDTVAASTGNTQQLTKMAAGGVTNISSMHEPFESRLDRALGIVVENEKPFHGYNPNKNSRNGGLNAKGRAKAKRETGANLKPPVTDAPSTLDPNSKKAKRRKSFCARMSGVPGPTSKGGKKTAKGAALNRWNC